MWRSPSQSRGLFKGKVLLLSPPLLPVMWPSWLRLTAAWLTGVMVTWPQSPSFPVSTFLSETVVVWQTPEDSELIDGCTAWRGGSGASQGQQWGPGWLTLALCVLRAQGLNVSFSNNGLYWKGQLQSSDHENGERENERKREGKKKRDGRYARGGNWLSGRGKEMKRKRKMEGR